MNRTTALVGSAAAVAIAALTVVTTSAIATNSSPSEASDVVAALSQDSTKADLLPEGLSYDGLGTGGLVPDSLRLLATDEMATYRVGLDGAKQICLVVTLTDEILTTGSTCAPPSQVEADGLWMGLQGDASKGSLEHVIYLLPDSAAEEDVSGPWELVAKNLIVASSDSLRAYSGETVIIGRSSGDKAPISLVKR